MKIDNFYRKNLRNDEHFQFHREFRDLVTASGAESLKVAAHFSIYEHALEKEDEGLKRIVKSVYTEKIREADKARDSIYEGMVEMNSASLKHYSPDTREAAKRLKILFDSYGNLSSKPLNEQTSAVHNILQELHGDYLDAARIVGITGWVDKLEARNNAFEALVRERYNEAASKTRVVVKEAREEVDAAYDTIVERINALVVVEGEEAYAAFIKKLNAVITKYAAVLNVRLGKRSHKQGVGTGAEDEALTEVAEGQAAYGGDGGGDF